MSSSDGASFDLRLQGTDEGQAVYSAQFNLGESLHDVGATVDVETGEVNWRGDAMMQVPAWILKYATVALRAGYRGQATEGWPRRLTRWRAAPAKPAGS